MKIVTWNIACMPKYINLYGDPLKRINHIIVKLIELDADIICLQEVFCYKTRDLLKKEFKDKYNICHSLKSKKRFTLNSGLFFATKYKILHDENIIFKESCGEDSLASKGFQYILLKNNDKIFSCVNTHLNAVPMISAYGNSNLVRTRQIECILRKILDKKYEVNLFCGDINTEYNSHPQLYFMNSLKKSYDYCIMNNTKISTFQLEQLDYIIYYGKKNPNIKYEKILSTKESDHHLLLCTLK